jgi:hypothetical protein
MAGVRTARLRIQIERYTDDHFPGFVECSFVDAAGRTHLFEDKVLIVTAENLDAQSPYPRPGDIACTVTGTLGGADGREVVTIDIDKPLAIETREGLTRFEVLREQLVD